MRLTTSCTINNAILNSVNISSSIWWGTMKRYLDGYYMRMLRDVPLFVRLRTLPTYFWKAVQG